MTRRQLFTVAAGVAAVSCSRDTRRRLNILNWGDYIDPAILADFEREFAVRIRYGTFENNEELLGKVMSGNSGWDVVFPTHNRIAPMRELSLLAPLDTRRLGLIANLGGAFRSPRWDPSFDWSIPYLWTTTGIAHNAKSYSEQPQSWGDLWHTAAKGKLTMLDDVDDVFGAALAKLGHPYSSADTEHLRQAQREIVNQKPLVRAYLSTEARDQMVAGDVTVAQTFATTAQLAIDGNPDVVFRHPKEQFGAYCDCAVILRESKRVELAHEFLNFLLRPDVSLKIARKIRTGTPNAKSAEAMSPAERANPVLYPSEETLRRADWPLPLPPDVVRLRDRLWTEAKSA